MTASVLETGTRSTKSFATDILTLIAPLVRVLAHPSALSATLTLQSAAELSSSGRYVGTMMPRDLLHLHAVTEATTIAMSALVEAPWAITMFASVENVRLNVSSDILAIAEPIHARPASASWTTVIAADALRRLGAAERAMRARASAIMTTR